MNLGELALDDHNRSELYVIISLPAFGLIVTAEPYFAITEPSDVVVLDNYITSSSKGRAVQTAKYQPLPQGHYIANVRPAVIKRTGLATFNPLELNQAQNAVRIARLAGAEEYARESLAKAECLLRQAEKLQSLDPDDFDTKSVSATARAAVEAAEEARWTAVMNQAGQSVARVRVRAVSE